MAKNKRKHEKSIKRETPPIPAERGPDAEWFRRRFKHLGLMVGDVAKNLDLHSTKIPLIWNGSRRLQLDEAAKLAQLLKVPIAELVAHMGIEIPPHKVRLIGSVTAIGRVSEYPPERQEMVEAPSDASGNMVALVVEAPESGLSIWDGSYLYYEPTEIVRADAYGRLSVIAVGDQMAKLVGVLSKAPLGKGRVRIFGGSEVVETNEVCSAAPIKWQKA